MQRGRKVVVLGCMFSGKTAESIRLAHRAESAGKKVLVVVHSADVERTKLEGKAVSHDNHVMDAVNTINPLDIYHLAVQHKADVVIIDEAWLFEAEPLNKTCTALQDLGKDVIANGLNQDFRGNPFPTMMLLAGNADKIVSLTAVCKLCNAEDATRTQRLINGQPASYNSPTIIIGDDKVRHGVVYMAVCAKCHKVPDRPMIPVLVCNPGGGAKG